METKEYFMQYSEFVNSVTAEVSKKDDLFLTKVQELSDKLNGNYSRLDNAIAGLCGEVGEVSDLWKKVKFMDLEYNDEIKDLFIKELGDVCWYLFQTSRALNVPVDEIIDKNIEKLKKRHPYGYSPAYFKETIGKK